MENDPITVAASRDGHEYHEAWATRIALGLVPPNADLKAIAMEGFAKEEANEFSREAMDIADMVQYFGGHPSENAERVIVTQFKYVASESSTELSASHISKTISKFLDARRDYIKEKGADWVESRLEFEFVTNRIVGNNLKTVIEAIVQKMAFSSLSGDQRRQYRTLTGGDETSSQDLEEVLKKLNIVGASSSLRGEKASIRNSLAHWGGANDAMAKLRSLSLSQLLRDKAGTEGYKNNVVKRTDVLGALDLSDEDELLPVPQSFPAVESVVARPFLKSVVKVLLETKKPFLIHGAGGSGKTVMLQALAHSFDESSVCILHDGFGGGRWRMPGDDRHLSSRSLVHLINSIAVKGLCDPLLPGADDGTLLRTSLRRLKQATAAIQNQNSAAKIVLLLDAIDHAGLRAEATNSNSFAKQLIGALLIKPVDGLVLVASCRTERRGEAIGDLELPDFEIPPFDDSEINERAAYFDKSITSEDTHVLKARSIGNPRCLDAFLESGRPYDSAAIPDAHSNAGEVLDKLIQTQFKEAMELSASRGVPRQKTEMLLQGMSILPPPIPIQEIAEAYSLASTEIVSFFSDLSPMIEVTEHGLIFRDEPTETVARKSLEGDATSLGEVVTKLKTRQSVSTYATRCLPHVLQELNLTDDLVELAFSKNFPKTITSSIAVTGIQTARITKAVESCATERRIDDLFQLAMEAAGIAGGSDRSDALIERYPELVAASNDPEALRRLVENKTRWPGRHHGTLAVTQAFLDCFDEAKRQAHKSIDWLNHDSESSSHTADYEPNDWKRPLYVLLLDGHAEKIIDWLSQRNANDAFRFFVSLLEMLQRHVPTSQKAMSMRDSIIDLLLDGSLNQPWCFAAALFALEINDSRKIKLIQILTGAGCSDSLGSKFQWEDRDKAHLKDAFLNLSVQAFLYGLRREAKVLLDWASIERPSRWEFENQHDNGGAIARWVLASSIRCVLKGRKASVREVIPSELWAVIPSSTKKRGPKAIETAYEKLLKAPSKNRKNKKELNVDKISQCLTHRSKPLIPVIQSLQILLNHRCDAELVRDYLTKLADIVDKESNYPFRDQKRFIAYQSFKPLFRLVSLSNNWDEAAAKQIAQWIPRSPLNSPNEMFSIVGDLAKSTASNEAALSLAAEVFQKLKHDDQIESRLDGICRLAMAIWAASREEAGAYFKEALNFAAAVGSDNHEEISWLANIAASYNGPPMSQSAVHDFNRICELGLPYEEEKFIWPTYSQGLARIGGYRSISFLTRLADRGKADLRWSLLPFLQELVVAKRIDPGLAASLFGLDKLTERWDWNAGGFVSSVLDLQGSDHRELFAHWVIQELDRTYKNDIPRDTLEDILVGFTELNSESSPRERVTSALELANKKFEEKYPDLLRSGKSEQSNTHQFEVDLSNVDEVDAFLQNVGQKRDDYQNAQSALIKLSNDVSQLDDRVKFLRVIRASEVANLADKLAVFDKVSEAYGASSLVLREFFESLPVLLAESHADELWGSNWGADSVFRKLMSRAKGQEAETLCCALLASKADLAEFSACDWLRYAYWLSNSVKQSNFENSFAKLASRLAETIPDGLSDPVFSEMFSLIEDENTISAQLVWCRLGSPDARVRWRAAHAMVRLAHLDSLDVLDQIISQFSRTCAAPFNDEKLPFYHLHAKLWMLIALAKISKEMPNALMGRQKVFVDAIKSHSDHALIKHFAFTAIQTTPNDLLDPDVSKTLPKIEHEMKVQGIIPKDQLGRRRDHYGGRPDGKCRKDGGFYFDHDFDKNTLNGLGRLFNKDTWKVEEDVASQVKQWNDEIKYMSDCPRGLSGGDWQNGDRFTDGYGTYLAYHAVWSVAGRYFKNHKVAEDTWSDDPWGEWISVFLPTIEAQTWLSDAMDQFPLDQSNVELKLDDPKEQTKSYERPIIASLTGVENGKAVPEQVIVDGWWQDDNGNDIKVNSGLVKKQHTDAVVESLLLTDPFFQWIPSEDDHQFSSSGTVPIESWLVNQEIHSEGIDVSDPYAVKHAAQRTRPNDKTIASLSLDATDNFGRLWVDKNKDLFLSSEAWGFWSGQDRHESELVGDRLTANTQILKNFLKDRERNLIILVKVQRYVKSGEYGGKFATKSAAIVVPSVGPIKVRSRISSKSRSAVRSLGEHDQTNFPKCYEVVSKQI